MENYLNDKMDHSCHQHAEIIGKWLCIQCNTCYCDYCIRTAVDKITNRSIFLCPKCDLPAANISISQAVPPFWKNLFKILRYPMSPHSSLLILCIATFYYVAGISDILPDGLNLIILILTIWILINYSYLVLKTTAITEISPPKISIGLIKFRVKDVIIQILIVLPTIVLLSTALLCENHFIRILSPVILFFVPAVLISLVATDNVVKSLNPIFLLGLVYRIGWGYIVLFAIVALSLCLFFGIVFLAQPTSAFIQFGLTLAAFWGMISGYHLFGWVMVQYHDRIGYNIQDLLIEEKKNKINFRKNAVTNSVDFLILKNRDKEAIAFIKNQFKNEPITDIDLAHKYLHLLKAEDPETLHSFYAPYIDMLVRSNEKKTCCEVFSECISTSDSSISAFNLFRIGGWLTEKGDVNLAVTAYERIIKYFPENAVAPKAFLRLVQIYDHNIMDASKVENLIEKMVELYPNSESTCKAIRLTKK